MCVGVTGTKILLQFDVDVARYDEICERDEYERGEIDHLQTMDGLD